MHLLNLHLKEVKSVYWCSGDNDDSGNKSDDDSGLFDVKPDVSGIDEYDDGIVLRISGAFGVFLFRHFMTTIPDELLEASRLDGASEFRIFFSIILPMSKPILAFKVF